MLTLALVLSSKATFTNRFLVDNCLLATGKIPTDEHTINQLDGH
jgi:hypothetical protein